MKKIKKFKINIRLREVLRLIKNTSNIEISPEKIEELLHNEISRLKKIVLPAAIYETYPKEKLPIELVINPPEKWVAASLYITSIGKDVENIINEKNKEDENFLMHIQHSIAVEALSQTGNFISRLLNDEAKSESCVLDKEYDINTAEYLNKFFEFFSGDKIGVGIVDEKIRPLYSSAGIIYWIPQKKQSAKNKK